MNVIFINMTQLTIIRASISRIAARASLIHQRIRSSGAQLIKEETVSSIELAVREARVSFLTVFRGSPVRVKHSHRIYIKGGLFGTVNLASEITKQSSMFPHFADEDVANEAVTIIINPLVFFRDSEQNIKSDSIINLSILVYLGSGVDIGT